MSHRKQPVRQARVNQSRNVQGARSLGASSGAAQPYNESPPGFFPGITHFTDSITALPKDMIKHFTMLKEVDAKIGRPEEALKRLVGDVLKKPIPRARGTHDVAIAKVISSTTQKVYEMQPFALEAPSEEQYDQERRQQCAQIVMHLRNMLVTMDEKTHVLSTANEELDKHIARCESSWPQIEKEISEVTRLGNPNHRALDNEVAPEKKPSAVGERPRREAAMSNAHAGLAGEDGRATSRKQRAHQHLESDYDEPRAGKGKGNAKGKRSEAPTSGAVGLGIVNGTATNKRRKVEKTSGAVGSVPMDRTATSAYSRNGGPGAASPSQAGAENPKKRARGTAMAAAVGGRKRAGTQNSATNSPAMASSPVLGSFGVTARGGASPAIGAAMQRSSSTRARQNSTQNATSQPRAPTSAAKELNGTYAPPLEVTKISDQKTVKTEDSALAEAPPGSRSSGRTIDRPAAKKEDSGTRHRPPSISTGTRNNGRASKTATPVSSSFPEAPRPRSGRNNTVGSAGAGGGSDGGQVPPLLQQKRSHKKGAGLAAQQQKAALEAAVAKAAAVVTDEAGSALEGEDEEDGENEPRYCYCGGVSYGEMVACDWKGCAREWFHLDCAGLGKAPGKEKWYCRDCAPKVR